MQVRVLPPGPFSKKESYLMPEIRDTDPDSWYLGDDDIAICYMDGVDWQHHTLSDMRGTRVYPSETDLRRARSCLDQCGIVEVEVRVRRWIQPQRMRETTDEDEAHKAAEPSSEVAAGTAVPDEGGTGQNEVHPQG